MTIKESSKNKGADSVYSHTHAENQPPRSAHDKEIIAENTVGNYWQDNKRVLFILMGVWVFVTFGCGIIFGDWLDNYNLGGFPLGFWFTQQGAMLIYVALIFIYHFWMKRIEFRHGVDDTPSIENSAKPLNKGGQQ